MIPRTVLPVLLFSLSAVAQVPPSRPPFIRATGNASVSVQPDIAKLDLGVVTQANTAEAASSQNATQTTAVIAALHGLLGADADIKTLNYTVSPNHNYPNGGTPTITGYTVTNTVTVTLTDLGSVGKVVDTAVSAGANNVQSLAFTSKDDSAARQQALRLAAQKAMSDANAIASGLNVHTGAVISATEGATVIPAQRFALSAAITQTPIQPNDVSIQATVTVDVQIAQ